MTGYPGCLDASIRRASFYFSKCLRFDNKLRGHLRYYVIFWKRRQMQRRQMICSRSRSRSVVELDSKVSVFSVQVLSARVFRFLGQMKERVPLTVSLGNTKLIGAIYYSLELLLEWPSEKYFLKNIFDVSKLYSSEDIFHFWKYSKHFQNQVLWIKWEITLGNTFLEPNQRLSLNWWLFMFSYLVKLALKKILKESFYRCFEQWLSLKWL